MKIHFSFKCIFRYKIAPNMALKKRMSKRSNYCVSMKKSNSIKTIFVTIQPPPNRLANIDFDVIGTSDYELMEK